jgi:hypothetical protein
VRKILSICSPTGLLVGGQAAAFWADYLPLQSVPLEHFRTTSALAGDVALVDRGPGALYWNVTCTVSAFGVRNVHGVDSGWQVLSATWLPRPTLYQKTNAQNLRLPGIHQRTQSALDVRRARIAL